MDYIQTMAYKTTVVLEIWTHEELDAVKDPIAAGRLAASRDNGCASLGRILKQTSEKLTEEQSKALIVELGEDPDTWK